MQGSSGRRALAAAEDAAPQPPELPAVPVDWALLPDDVLQAILGCLSLKERHASAVRVCRLWHRCCYSPSLLRDLRFSWPGPPSFAAPECTLHWLSRNGAARHAQRVSLRVRLARATSCAVHHTLLGGIFTTLGASAAGLQQLSLDLDDGPIVLAGWPATMATLTSLQLSTTYRVELGQAMLCLSSLRRLDLSAAEVAGLALLPRGITRLAWRLQGQPRTEDGLPAELALLTGLRSLRLARWRAGGVRAELPSLLHLHLWLTPLPRELHRLGGLRSLAVQFRLRGRGGADDHSVLWAALRALPHLTALQLDGEAIAAPQLSQALDGLLQLRRLVLSSPDVYSDANIGVKYAARDGRSPDHVPAGLQHGAWAERLTLLGLDCPVALANLQLLQAATGLQTLWLLGDCHGTVDPFTFWPAYPEGESASCDRDGDGDTIMACGDSDSSATTDFERNCARLAAHFEARQRERCGPWRFWRPLLEWAAGQAPALRHISLRPAISLRSHSPFDDCRPGLRNRPSPSEDVLAALAELQQQRPGLTVSVVREGPWPAPPPTFPGMTPFYRMTSPGAATMAKDLFELE